MQNESLTFGEKLDIILKKNGIPISSLTALTNTKSRNAIYRILRDETSIDVIENFYQKLSWNHHPFFSKEELQQLKNAIEINKFGRESYFTRKIILNTLIRKEKDSKKEIMLLNSSLFKTLNQLFHSYTSCSSLDIIIFDATFIELSKCLLPLIRKCDLQINIKHFIYLNQTKKQHAEIFAVAHTLLGYDNYQLYLGANPIANDIIDTSFFSNLMVIKKTIHEKTFIDTVMFKNKTTAIITIDDSSDSNYNLFRSYLNSQEAYIKRIHREKKNSDALTTIIDLCIYLSNFEKNSSTYLVKHNMCFQMIYIDILYQMLVDADFFDLTSDHPLIKKLVEVSIERFQTYHSPGKKRIHFFTKDGLLDFIKSKTLTDHVFLFRPFTVYEVRLQFEFMLKQLSNNKDYKIYLLKEDFYIHNIEITYFEDTAIHLFDSLAGYSENFDEAVISTKPILHVFDDFVKNELIKHTYPEDETYSFIEKLLLEVY